MLDIFAELSGVRDELFELRKALLRIAEALERVSPPIPAPAADAVTDRELDARASSEHTDAGFTFAESPEQYQERTSRDAEFAVSLGIAPWSPDFQSTILQMKYDLMRPHMENVQDEEGNWHAAEQEGRSEEEAEQIVRDSFRIARAEANVRQGAAI
jgi:hypothetical protein